MESMQESWDSLRLKEMMASKSLCFELWEAGWSSMERISPKLLKISSKVSWVTFRDKYLILTLF